MQSNAIEQQKKMTRITEKIVTRYEIELEKVIKIFFARIKILSNVVCFY